MTENMNKRQIIKKDEKETQQTRRNSKQTDEQTDKSTFLSPKVQREEDSPTPIPQGVKGNGPVQYVTFERRITEGALMGMGVCIAGQVNE